MSQNVGLGMRSFLGFGDESTWGVPAARTNFIEIISESLAKSVALIKSNSILRRGILRDHVGPGAISLAGDVVFDVTYGGWLKLAKHAFGSVVDSQPDITNAPTAYQHLFNIADTPLPGLTFEVFRDSSQFVTEPNKSFLYSGVKVSGLELSCGTDQILKGTAQLIGSDATRGAKSTDTYTSSKVAVYHQGVVQWNSVDVEVDTFTLKIENGFGARPKLGSQFSREPVPESKLAVSGSFQMEFASWAQVDDFYNTQDRAFQVTFLGDVIGGAIRNKIDISCPVSLLSNAHVVLDKPGRVIIAADFEAFRTQVANEVTMTVVNTEATV